MVKQQSKRILLVGEPMALLTANRPGELASVEDFSISVAGAEYNVAIGLARLGHEPVYTTRLGRDPFGKRIFAGLVENRIATERILWDETRQTGMMLKGRAAAEGDDPDIFYFRKNSAASALTKEQVEEWSLKEYAALHLTGIFPALNEGTRGAVLALAKKARQAGCLVSFDPNLRPSLWESEEQMKHTLQEIASLADVVLPGLQEGRILTGKDTPEEIAGVYHAMGVRAVVIKTGAEGAFYSICRIGLDSQNGRNGRCFIEQAQTGYVSGFQAERVVDTVGAGDGFAVGVLSGLLEELPGKEKRLFEWFPEGGKEAEAALRKAVQRGNAIGCLQVMHRGDNEGLPTREALADFFSKHRESSSSDRGSSVRAEEESFREERTEKEADEENVEETTETEVLEKRLRQLRIVPVIQLERPEQGVPLARALAAGGLPVAEITFRTAAAEEAIRTIHKEVPEVLILAGTVLDVETAKRAIEAGASAIVSPGTNPEVVAWCLERQIPVLPGCATPTEIEACRRMGLHIVKFFPAEAAGGVKMLRSLAGPYRDMSFMPTGGISPENLGDYLALPHVVACGGSYMVPGELLKREDYGEIQRLVEETVRGLG